jgi:rRNA maturation endonuclease Nob1
VLKVVPATNETDVLAAPKDTPAPQGDESPDTDQADTEAKTDDDEQAPADAAPLIRKKINKLLADRRELRKEVAELRPNAQIGSELTQFATVNDLSGDDVTNVLRMAAMLRVGDYASFYKAVAPFVRTAQEYLGVVLPRDLADRVRAGHMTEVAAKEFARQRYDHQRSQVELESTQVAASRQRVQSTQNEVQRAVLSYEQRLSANDPDYKAKAPSVRRAVQAILFERGGTIQNANEALEITKAAYDEVNKQMRSYQPRPTATRPQPNGATQTTSARAAPKTLMEAALQGLDNARRAGG